MPKPIMLGVEVEEVALGTVLRRIDAMRGVLRIHWNLRSAGGKPDKAAKPNGQRKPYQSYEITGEEAMLKMLHGRPPMSNSQIKDGFAALGRSPKSINSLIHNLKQNGEMVRTDDGWTLSKKARDKMRHRKAKS